MQFDPNQFKVNPKYHDKWYQFSGDVNAKDHGGVFIWSDGFGIKVIDYHRGDDEGIELGTNPDTGKPYRYCVTEHFFDVADLKENYRDYANLIGIEDNYLDDHEGDRFVALCVDGLVSCGRCAEIPVLFSAFVKAVSYASNWSLLPSAWVPGDYFIAK